MVKFTILNENIFNYLIQHQSPISKSHRALLDITEKHPQAIMCTAENQVGFMVLLAKLMQAKKIIEIGVFTGVTSLALAETLPKDGKLIACDISEEFTQIGMPYWEAGGVRNKIDLRINPALATLNQLLLEGLSESFDLIYIDANKEEYINYMNLALKLVRSGGLILADNALKSGEVADLAIQENTTRHLRDFNSYVRNIRGINFNLLPIGDGLMMVLKE